MNKKIIITSIIFSILLTIGISLAYILPRIEGTGEEITLKGKEVKVIFTDSAALSDEITLDWETTKTFSVENQSKYPFYFDIVIENLVNTFVTEGYLQYKITSDDNSFSTDWKNIPKSPTANDTTLEHYVKINGSHTVNYTLHLHYMNDEETDQSDDMGKRLAGTLQIKEGTRENLLANRILEDNVLKGTRGPDNAPFTNIVGTEELSGLYQESGDFTEDMDNDGTGETVYYFVGDVKNNWVKFGKVGEEDIWWRIIRINEDGSVRLLYAGKGENGHATTTGYIDNKCYLYSSTDNNTRYVGYMYGSTGSLANNRQNGNPSTIKGVVDTWYDENMTKNDDQNHQYGTYLSKTAVYCNDRATSDYSTTSEMYYAADYRLIKNKRPSFKCGNDPNGTLYTELGIADAADRFTGSNESNIGNELLNDKPIALITADEIAYAGGVFGIDNSDVYYYQNSANESVTGGDSWWTMSSRGFSGAYAEVFSVYGSSNINQLSWGRVIAPGGVRPVLSLKSCVTVSKGTGVVNGDTVDPYEVTIDDACALADN